MTPEPPSSHHDELGYTQNFLHNPELVERIVRRAALKPGDTVLEVGPGKGIITKKLADAVGPDGQVIAVELDTRLADSLSIVLRPLTQVKILSMDILHFDFSSLPPNYAVFSNIPFNITSTLLETLLNPYDGPAQAHLILQRDALIATNEQGTPAETFKSMLIKPLYEIELVVPFLKSDFIPQPSVATALFSFVWRSEPLIDPHYYEVWKDFLAAISKDRAGEGIWRRLFSSGQTFKLQGQHGLVMGRGLKSQPAEAIIAAFELLATSAPAKLDTVEGAMAALREEQARREDINRAGGHRRHPRQNS
jgi:23S rRNA (adenine-N6)-dimethyltransferase